MKGMFLSLITYDSRVKQKINLPNFFIIFFIIFSLIYWRLVSSKIWLWTNCFNWLTFLLEINILKLPRSREPTTPMATSRGKQSAFALSTVAEAALKYYWVPNLDCLPPEVASVVVVTITRGCFSRLLEIAEALL